MKNLLDFRRNMLLFIAASAAGAVYTYVSGGNSFNSDSFQMCMIFLLVFTGALLMAQLGIYFLERKEMKESEIRKKENNNQFKKQKKKKKKRNKG